jgi:hypothetical protein
MADWPDTAELAQVLNVENVTDWETTLDRVQAAAISKVKSDVGNWDEDVDEPDESLSQAALRMAELISERPGQRTAVLGKDPAYQALLFGHRRSFGIG